ncbi:hypothetical protein TNCV_4331931 [Trichonephila clavipes]|nr:hypothetical protein TNCV_4331931 [Trichonephila clavipes]
MLSIKLLSHDLEEDYSTLQLMVSKAPVDMKEVINKLQVIGKACLTHAISDSSQVRMLAIPNCWYPQIAYDVCSVRTGVAILKHKFCSNSTPK